MAYRCPDCNVFVSVGLADPPEIVYITADETGGSVISGELVLTLECENCGSELAETNVDFEFDDKTLAAHVLAHEETGKLGEYIAIFEVEEYETMPDDFFDDRARHFYGAEIKAGIVCKTCNYFAHEIVFTKYEQASAFDLLY